MNRPDRGKMSEADVGTGNCSVGVVPFREPLLSPFKAAEAGTGVDSAGHFVHFYESDDFLVKDVGAFLKAGLDTGEGALIIATSQHRKALDTYLERQGVDLEAARRVDRYVALDAAETLAKVTVGGALDSARLDGIACEMLDRVGKRAGNFRVFGEMVALLWAEGRQADTFRLEKYWDDLSRTQGFSLYCCYPARAFHGADFSEKFSRICQQHTRVLCAEIPGESIDRAHAIALLQQKAGSLEMEVVERKRAEQTLRENEDRFRRLMSLMPAAVYTCDEKGRITFFNRKAAELWGREPRLNADDQKFCGALRLWREDGSAMCHEATPMAEAIQQGKATHNREITIERPDGSRVIVSVNVDPLHDAAGCRTGAINVFQDITRRKQADFDALRLAAIVESSDDAIVAKDLNGIVFSWNKGAERIFGYTEKEMLGKPISILIPAERHNEEPEILRRIGRGDRVDHYETMRQRKDGRLVEISLSVSAVRDRNGRIIGASKIARDITERKRIERQQRALHELVVEINRTASLPENFDAAIRAVMRCQDADRAAILLSDEQGVMRFNAWHGLSERYRRAVEGHSPWSDDDCSPAPVWFDDVAAAPLETSLRSEIEREGIRALAFVPIIHENRLVGKFVIYYNKPHQFTSEGIRPTETIAIQIAFAIERKKSGDALERLVHDRTASLREAIAQMEEFSYSVSHDLRAPVRAMQGYAGAVLEDCAEQLDEQSRHYLERIVRSGVRMDRLIQDILSYSGLSRREIRLQPISLSRLIREIISQYPEMQHPLAEIELVEPLHEVIGHEPSLSQAVSNLLSNAVKFVRPGETARVRVLSERRGSQVRLAIEDDGIGIKPEHQHRLFGMFERIHPENRYEGTGIGLAIVRKAMERMGGTAGLQSDGIKGSRFWIELPGAPVS